MSTIWSDGPRWIRQRFCRHWFDVKPYEYDYVDEPIVGVTAKQWSTAAEKRTCSKCGLTEYRRVGQPKFLGWG